MPLLSNVLCLPTAPSGRPSKSLLVVWWCKSTVIVTRYADLCPEMMQGINFLSGTLACQRYTPASYLFCCSLKFVSHSNKMQVIKSHIQPFNISTFFFFFFNWGEIVPRVSTVAAELSGNNLNQGREKSNLLYHHHDEKLHLKKQLKRS